MKTRNMSFKFVLYLGIVVYFKVSIVEASLLMTRSVRTTSLGLKTFFDNAHKRSKRDILSEIPQIIQCSTNCIVPIIASIVQESMNYNSRPGTGQSFVPNQMNQQDLDEYCRIFRNTSMCSEACPSQSFRDTIREATAIPRFICVERYQEFQRFMPCLNQVGVESDERCTSQCARYDSIEAAIMGQLNQTQRQFQQSGNDGSNPMNNFFGELLKQSCQYSTCLLECQKQLVVTRCGPDAQRLLEDMISISFKSMDDMSGYIGLNLDLPPECIQIQGGVARNTSNGNVSFPQPPQSGFFQPNQQNQFQQQGQQQQQQGFPPQPQFPQQQQQNQFPQQQPQNQGFVPGQNQNQNQFQFQPSNSQQQSQQYPQAGIMTGVGRQGR